MILKCLLRNILLLANIQFCVAMNGENYYLQNLNNCLQDNIYNSNNTIKELYDHTTEFFYDINLVKCSQLSIDNVVNKHIKLILYLNYINDSLIPHNFYENISYENERYQVIGLLSNIRNNVISVIEDCLNNKQNTF